MTFKKIYGFENMCNKQQSSSQGFCFGANLLCHTHACCSYVSFGLEDDSCQFASICLVIVYNKNTIYLRKKKFKKKKMQKAWQFISQCIHFPRMLYLVALLFLAPSLFVHGLCHVFMLLVLL